MFPLLYQSAIGNAKENTRNTIFALTRACRICYATADPDEEDISMRNHRAQLNIFAFYYRFTGFSGKACCRM